MSKKERDGPKVKLKNEKVEKMFEEVKEEIEEAKEGEIVTVSVPRSKWERWITPKYMLKAFNVPSQTIKIKKTGKATLKSLEQKLADLHEENEMDKFLRAIYEIGAVQTIGAQYANFKGYPKEKMKESLSIKNFENIEHQLEQLEMIEKDEGIDYFGPILSSDGEDILREYCERKIFNSLEEEIIEIIEEKDIHPRWIYTYFHKNNHKKDNLSTNEMRTSEVIEKNTHFLPTHLIREVELYGLLKKIVESKAYSENHGESSQHNDPILRNKVDFWAHLEEENLAISAPLVTFNKRDVDKIHNKKIRCIPVPIAEKIFELAKDHLHHSEKVILDILMVMDKFNSEPKKVEQKVRSAAEEEGLTIENLSDIVNHLSEKGITSSWSEKEERDLPYIMKDYDEAFLDFCRDYVLGEEDIEL